MTEKKRNDANRIIKCNLCKKDIKLIDLPYHLQKEHSDIGPNQMINLIQTHIPLVNQVKSDDFGKLFSMEVIVKQMKVFTYPPLDFTKLDISEEIEPSDTEIITKLAGRSISLGNGYIILNNFRNQIDALNYFDEIVSIFNIFGIPIDFFNDTDLILQGVNPSNQNISLVTSQMAIKRNTNIPHIRLNLNDFGKLMIGFNFIWEKIQNSNYFVESKVYEYLARALLAEFTSNYKLSFIYAWIFIEAMIDKVWNDSLPKLHGIDEKNKKKVDDILNDQRSWTINIKTEVLFLLKIIPPDQAQMIDTLRKKRNNIFHFNPKKQETITHKDAWNAIYQGLRLFYKELSLDSAFFFEDLRKNIYTAIHRPDLL